MFYLLLGTRWVIVPRLCPRIARCFSQGNIAMWTPTSVPPNMLLPLVSVGPIVRTLVGLGLGGGGGGKVPKFRDL